MTNTPPPPPGMPGQPQHGGIQPPSNPGMPQQSGYGQPQPSAYGAPPSSGSPQPVVKPQSIKTAQIMMYVGAAISILNIVIAFLSRDAIETEVRAQLLEDGQTLTDSQIDAAVALGLAFAVIVGLIGVGLWLLMAWANGNGKKWARITATVFYGLYLLSFLYSFSQPGTTAGTLLGVVGLALGGVIIYFLWGGKGSKQYYDMMS